MRKNSSIQVIKKDRVDRISFLKSENTNEIRKIRKEKSQESITYGEILGLWLQTIRLKIKESTYSRYYWLVETHIFPHLGHYNADEITTELLSCYIGEQLTKGRLDTQGGLSGKTVSDILTIIKSSIKFARAGNYEIPCSLPALSVRKKETPMRVLSPAEHAKLVNELVSQTDLIKFGILLALYTGIRIGELCALKWQDFDFSKGSLQIRRTMQRIRDYGQSLPHKTRIIITEPKSRSSVREIPLPIPLLPCCQKFISDADAYILTGRADCFVEPRTMQNYFKRIVTKSGIPDANFHALRHTFATRCVELGFDLKSLSEILGHANVNITLNRYVHSSFALKQSNMNKLRLPNSAQETSLVDPQHS